MDQIIEAALAKQVLDNVLQNRNEPDYPVFALENKEIVHEKTIKRYDIIQTLMNTGVSPLTVLDQEGTLIRQVFRSTSNNAILTLFIDLLSHEHISQLSQREVLRLYNSLQQNDISDISGYFLTKAFTLGFDFKQGCFTELTKALNGDLKFFELCLEHKADFKFDFKYLENKFLDEHLSAELESSSTFDDNLEQKRDLLVFLQQTRKVHSLKNNLEQELRTQTTVAKKNKI